ncbi:MAG: DUF1010 domain-containing protein [Proteobacteria bacterium]|nr:DUF1010 domain-containing protein [Pseudomonadota bacterium]
MQATINSSVSPFSRISYLGFWCCAGIPLLALRNFQVFLASSDCPTSVDSYSSCSVVPPRWRSIFSWTAPVFKSGRPFLAIGSNCSSQPTGYAVG